MSNTDTQMNETLETPCLIGRVKWFNSKNGFGFITITEGERTGEEIFVHYSGIVVENEQYRYLVQGEYVSFQLTETNNSDHEFQASRVRGVNQGQLMCETQKERTKQLSHRSRRPNVRRGRGRRRGGVSRVQRERYTTNNDNEEWILIRRNRQRNERPQRQRRQQE